MPDPVTPPGQPAPVAPLSEGPGTAPDPLNDVVGQVPIPNGPGLEGKPVAKRDVSAREALDYFTAQQSSEGPGKATYEELPEGLQKYADAHKAYRARQDANRPTPGIMDGFSLNKAVEEVSGSLIVGPIKAVNNMAKFAGLGGDWASYPQPQTIAGGITQGVAQFLTGMVGVNKLQALAGVPKAVGAIAGLGDAAAANIVSSDPNAGRLSDLINEFPSLRNPVTKYLASDPNDSEAVGQLKNGLEGTVLGAFGEAFAVALRGLKTQWHGVESGQMVPEGAILHSQETSAEVQKILDNFGASLATPDQFRKGGFATPEQLALQAGEIPKAIPLDETQLLTPVEGAPKGYGFDKSGEYVNLDNPRPMGDGAPKEPQTEPVQPESTPNTTTNGGQLEVQNTTDGGSQIKSTPEALTAYQTFVDNLTPGQRKVVGEDLDKHGMNPADPVSAMAGMQQTLELATAERPFLNRAAVKQLTSNIQNAAEQQFTGAGSTLDQFTRGTRINLTKYQAGGEGAKIALNEVSLALKPLSVEQLKVVSLPAQAEMGKFTAEGDPAGVLQRMAGMAANQEQFLRDQVAAGILLQAKAKEAFDIAEKMRLSGGGNEFDQASCLKAMEDLADLANHVTGVSSGTARALGSYRLQKQLINASLNDLVSKINEVGGSDAIKEMAGKINAARLAGNPGALPKILEYTRTQKVGRAIGSGLVNILLSSVSPIMRAFISQTYLSIQAPAAKIVGGALSLNKSAIIEGFGQYVGMMQGMRNALKLADIAFKTDSSPLRGDVPRPNALSPEAFGFPSEGLDQTPIATGMDYLFHASRIMPKLLIAQHEFFKGTNYHGVVTGKAWAEAASLGLQHDDFVAHVAKKIAGAYDQTTGQALYDNDFQEASRSSLTQDLTPGGRMENINRAINSMPILKALAGSWFLKISANAIDTVGSMTPGLGLVKGITSNADDIRGLNGNGLKAAAIGRQVIGGSIISLAVLGAMNGTLNGFGPTDPVANKTWRQNGNKPYTATIGGVEFPYGSVEGIGSLMGLAVDATHFASNAPDKAKGITQAIIQSLAANLTSKSFLESTVETMNLVTDPNANVAAYFRNRASSLVPTIFKQASSAMGMDPDFAPQITSMMDAIKAKLPYVRGGLPTAYDALGKPLPYSYNDGNMGWDPLAGSVNLNRPVYNELTRIQKGITQPPMNWGNVPLSPEQYAKWNKLIGEVKIPFQGESVNLETYLTKVIQSEKYQRLGLGDSEYRSERLGEIVSIISGFRGKAQGQMMKPDSPDYDPTLERAVRNDRQNMKMMSTAQDPSKVNKLPTDPLKVLSSLNK